MTGRHTFFVAAACVALTAGACDITQTAQTGAQHQEALAVADGVLHKDASMSIMPVVVAGQPSAQVAEVVGIMLERGGMTNLELTSQSFQAPTDADLAETAKSVAEFVRTTGPTTDYVLYSEFRGTRELGFVEMRSVVASKAGEIVWRESQTATDADFARARPQEPLACCVLLAARLRPVFGLDASMRNGASPGRLATRWEKANGLPDKAELASMAERTKEFARAAPTATLQVYRPRCGTEAEASAAELAQLINNSRLTAASAVDDTPVLERQRDMNEQKVLWTMANRFSQYVRTNPPESEYVMFTDYLMGTGPKGEVGVAGVHFAICNRSGELVVVDFQNSHWPDFRAIAPKSRTDCDRLVVKRLAGIIK